MSKYNALEAMGVKNPAEIARYEIYAVDVDHEDVLRIIYDRKKGSILPVSRKYRFPQIKKSTMVDSGSRKTEVIFESSAEFRNAVAELGQLMDLRGSSVELQKLVAEEIKHLEEDFAARIAHIKTLVDKL
ncbi:MAG: DUF3461 family protein [Arenicellales bacterium]|jgi:hypothetical protein